MNETYRALFELALLVGAGIVGDLIASFANHRFTLSRERNGSMSGVSRTASLSLNV